MNDLIVSVLPQLEGFWEVKLNGSRLQYWEHRTNYVRYGDDFRLHIFTPTPYLRDRFYNKTINIDGTGANIIEQLTNDFLEKDAFGMLFSYSLSWLDSNIKDITIRDRIIEFTIDYSKYGNEDLHVTLFKNGTSKDYDKSGIAKLIDFTKIQG